MKQIILFIGLDVHAKNITSALACRVNPLIAAILLATLSSAALAEKRNGFDLSNASIPVSEILGGGPPRDGIPSIDAPKFVRPDAANFLRDDDIVLSLTRGETTRAYPLRVLVWHEIVNDTLADEPVAVTYCPLCGTGMVFDRFVAGKARMFGVSGLLFQSDVLMYDSQSESLWSQLKMEAVSGPDVGKKLRWLPSEHLTWKAWRAKHPGGEVLSTDTGHHRNYDGDAYADYFAREETMFPVPKKRAEFPNKTWVLGVIVGGKAKAYPVDKLPDGRAVKDTLGGEAVTVTFHRTERRPDVRDAAGKPLPSVMVFWFAWQAFYPQTAVWTPSRK
jgi:Protein of unknown function (DUF3179)